MIDDAELKDDVKTFREEVHVLNAQEVDMEVFLRGKTVQGEEGVIMLNVGLRTYD